MTVLTFVFVDWHGLSSTTLRLFRSISRGQRRGRARTALPNREGLWWNTKYHPGIGSRHSADQLAPNVQGRCHRINRLYDHRGLGWPVFKRPAMWPRAVSFKQ